MSTLRDQILKLMQTHVLLGVCVTCGKRNALVWPEHLPEQCQDCSELAAERADERKQS